MCGAQTVISQTILLQKLFRSVQPSLLAKLENSFLSVNTVGVLLFGSFSC